MKKLVIFFLCFVFFAQNVSAVDVNILCKQCLGEKKHHAQEEKKCKERNKDYERRVADLQHRFDMVFGALVTSAALVIILQGLNNNPIVNNAIFNNNNPQ